MSAKSHKPVKDAGKPRQSTALAVLKTPPSDLPEASADTGIITEEPKKQWWWRPKDSKTRALAAKINVMRAAGRKDADIAKRLKTTEASVCQARYIARKNGWWDKDDEVVELEVELAMNVDRK